MQVHRVRRLVVFVAAVTALRASRFNFHQPRGESHNASFANGGVLARRVDIAEDGAVLRQVLSPPGLRLWCFLIKLLLELSEADEGYQRRIPLSRRAEVILSNILECVSVPVMFLWVLIGFAPGVTVIVYRVMLRDSRERECATRDQALSVG